MIKTMTQMLREYQDKLLGAYRPEWIRQEARIFELERLLEAAVCPTMAADPNHQGAPCPWCVDRAKLMKTAKHSHSAPM